MNKPKNAIFAGYVLLLGFGLCTADTVAGTPSAGIFELDSPSYSVVEGDGFMQFTVNRNSGSFGAVSVSYILSNAMNANGAAVCDAGIDFINTGATINFANGETSQQVFVTICDDAVPEGGTESFDIFLQNPTNGASVGSPGSATVTIEDDDSPPDMNVSTDNASVADGDTTPSAAENSDFGTTGTTFGSVTRTWKITNLGTSTLLLDGSPAVQVTGPHAGDFTVTAQPASTSLGSGQQTTFSVTFDPTEAGLRAATIVIPNNDPDEDPYDFAIQGFAITSPPPTLGSYDDANVPLGGNLVINAGAAPTDSNDIGVMIPPELSGKITVDRHTATVRVTNAHPAKLPSGAYPVTVKATGYGGTTTTTFDLTVSAQACGGESGFANGSDLETANVQSGLVVGDFNNDGHQDIARLLGVTNRVAIHHGDGTGEFTFSGTYIDVGTSPQGAAAGDFNNDGVQDIAVANHGSASVSIILGSASGTYGAGPPIAVGSAPYAVAVGDFNNDANLDFAAANSGSNNVSIRLGDGMGGFSGTTNVPVGSFPTSVAVGDFNNDGNTDIVAVNNSSATASIRLGDGAGNFGGTTDVGVVNSPLSVAVGDFNADGNKDLAVSGTSSVSIRLGDGSGGFSGTTEVAINATPWSVAVGDFNGDGKQDLAATSLGSDTVSIRHGNGQGGFTSTADLAVGDGPLEVAIGDFNEDGKQDFATANGNETASSLRFGTCLAPEIDVSGNGVSIANGDTTPDVNDHTDFGPANGSGGSVTRTFRITNFGDLDLNLTGNPPVQINGTAAADFTVTVAPDTPIESGNYTEMQIKFEPSATGLRKATVSIANDDDDENPYNFSIQGTLCAYIGEPPIFVDGFEEGDPCD